MYLFQHPAPLPDTRNYAVNPLWKLSPPAPSLKISKVAHGMLHLANLYLLKMLIEYKNLLLLSRNSIILEYEFVGQVCRYC